MYQKCSQKLINSRYSLFIDDERYPPRNDGRNWIIARDFLDVSLCLRRNGMPGFVSFDHDLGENKRTGHDIVKLLIELDMSDDEQYKIPQGFEYYVHSQNVPGKANIEGLLESYLKHRNRE